MSPIEIIAYTGGKGVGKFGEIEVLEGTVQQLDQLKKHLIENWENMGVSPHIVYQGPDLKAAKEAIAGLPRVSEEVSASSLQIRPR